MLCVEKEDTNVFKQDILEALAKNENVKENVDELIKKNDELYIEHERLKKETKDAVTAREHIAKELKHKDVRRDCPCYDTVPWLLLDGLGLGGKDSRKEGDVQIGGERTAHDSGFARVSGRETPLSGRHRADHIYIMIPIDSK